MFKNVKQKFSFQESEITGGIWARLFLSSTVGRETRFSVSHRSIRSHSPQYKTISFQNVGLVKINWENEDKDPVGPIFIYIFYFVYIKGVIKCVNLILKCRYSSKGQGIAFHNILCNPNSDFDSIFNPKTKPRINPNTEAESFMLASYNPKWYKVLLLYCS